MKKAKPDTAGTRSQREQVAAFEEVKIRHPHYRDAFQRTWALATRGHASRVVIVTGPTGVGKSTLGASLHKQATMAAEAECKADPSIVPAVLVKAIAPHGRTFSWKDFYIRILEQLREPLIERKVWTHHQLTLLGPDVAGKTAADNMDTELLRRSLEHAFKRRQTRYLVVDEAHHMLMCHDERHLAFQFETLKSLADMCNATLVLLGTYRLLTIRDYSAQLIRRSQIVHFPCYRFDLVVDRAAFKSVLRQFADALPVPLDPELVSDVGYFFVKTAGCAGILRDLMRDALHEALEGEKKVISRDIVDRVAQPNKAIQTIIEEAACGVVALTDVDLATVEGLVKKPPADIVAERLRLQAGVDVLPTLPGAAKGPKRAEKRTRAVGERLPVRDRVGGPGRVNVA